MAAYLLYNDAWTIASLFDEAGNVVQFNTLIGGETGFEYEPIAQEHTAGDYQSGERNTLMIASPEFDGGSQLQVWKHENTPLAAVAVSTALGGRNYLWPEFVKLKELLNHPKGVRSEGDSFVKAVLEHYDVGPARKRNIAPAAGGELILPVAGPTLTLAATGPGAFELRLEAKDVNGATLAAATGSFDGTRASVALTLPAGTFKIAYGRGSAHSTSLRVDGSTEYVEG